MAFLESMIAGKLAKPYAEKAAKKVREKVDETKENLKTKAEGMALKSGLIGKKYPKEYEDEQRRESRGMKSGGMVSKAKRYEKGGSVDEDDSVSLEQTGGFGRAAVAEAAKRPTYRSTEGQVDERDRRQEAQAKTVRKQPAKSPIVTKEQMQKAGFDNLRDYMNAQKGLRRRGESSRQPSSQDLDRLEAASYAQGFRSDREKYMKGRGMKAGGMVSSVSKRADGIAKRGKTKCKIC